MLGQRFPSRYIFSLIIVWEHSTVIMIVDLFIYSATLFLCNIETFPDAKF